MNDQNSKRRKVMNNQVFKRGKTMIVLLAFVAAAVMALCFAACSAGDEDEGKDNPDLKGVGIKELITVKMPDGYSAKNNSGTYLPSGEMIQKHWTKEGGSGTDDAPEISISLLGFDGEPIGVDPVTIEEFIAGEEYVTKEYNGNKYFIVSGYSDDKEIADSELTAYVEAENYIVGFYLISKDTLTEKEKKMFYEVLKTVKFAHIYGKWQMYGCVINNADGAAGDLAEEDNAAGDLAKMDLTEKDIVSGKAYKTMFGTDVPDSPRTITGKGVKEFEQVGEGSEVVSWKKKGDDKYRLTIRITAFAGEEPLKKPITEYVDYVVKDGYLFEAISYDNEEYNGGNITVYKRHSIENSKEETQ